MERKDLVDKRLEAFKIFIDRALEDPDAFPDKALLFPYDIARDIFTKERVRLIKAIKEKAPASVKKLAKMLKRDPAAVDRDLKLLEKYEIVRIERSGKEAKPHIEKEILILPLIELKVKRVA